ncbi:LPS export ABC transporter periplasmic protein LptC [Spirochaeta lutea]|uniref:LPS export ABC transporter periplasmic protein LptC n=1 Tax=Spirochaeta lutea TaxID=1480694 RepID=A0A098QVN4_9SPIO|nr:LPS export ABC transporter periplasmic protein LptC [Spirochaeta lutea]KGE71880.1 hypothetical protein DC28_08650 [Spirochaeta lutea]
MITRGVNKNIQIRTQPRKPLALLLLLAMGLTTQACRLDYGADVEADSLSDQVPDIEVTAFRQNIYRNNSLLLRLEADHSRSYASRNLRELEGVRFEEYSLKGEVVSYGHADFATLFTDTEDVELQGNIVVYSDQEGAEVTGEYFYWSDSNRMITSLSDQEVQVVTDDGDRIQGRGFAADLTEKSIRFSGGVSGEVQAQEQDESSNDATE